MNEIYFPWRVREYENFRVCTYPNVIPNMYIIGTNGTVVNVYKNFVVSQRFGGSGYLQLHMNCIDGQNRDFMTHRLVAWEWVLYNRDASLDVNHIDGVKTNNYYMNLEWVLHIENVRHAFKTGLVGDCKGEHHRHKLTEQEVRQICEMLQDPNEYYQNIINQLNLDVAITTIQAIANGLNWSHISKDYNIPPRNRKKPQMINM